MNIIGIDLGGTKILGILADEHGAVRKRVRKATEGQKGPDHVIGCMVEMIQELIPPEGLDGIGVGVPGPMDSVKGIVYEPPNLPGWKDVPLRDLMLARLKLPKEVPFTIVNDANAAALAEFQFGAGSHRVLGRPIRNMVYLTISTGIGGGVIADGSLLLGTAGMAGELGHMVIDLFGPRCNCGNRGCLESLASGPALAREGAVVVAARRETSMSDTVGGDPAKVTAQIVEEAAKAGDPEALKLMEREGLMVGVGVVNCVHAFDPQLVVLGGGLTNAGDLLFDPVRATVAERVMPAYRGTFEIVPAALGNDVGALGAVAAALEKIRGR